MSTDDNNDRLPDELAEELIKSIADVEREESEQDQGTAGSQEVTDDGAAT